MATHSSVLAWETPWTERPGGLHSRRVQRVGQDLVIKQQQYVQHILLYGTNLDDLHLLIMIIIFKPVACFTEQI